MSPHNELLRLIDALFDGLITPEEAARLEQLVSASEDARRRFLDAALVHGDLYWQSTREGDAVAIEQDADFQTGLRAKPPIPRQRRMSPWPNLPRRESTLPGPGTRIGSRTLGTILLGVAAILVGVIVCLSGIGSRDLGQFAKRILVWDHESSSSVQDRRSPSGDGSGVPSPNSPARFQVAAVTDVEWSNGGTPDADGSVPLGGKLLLNRGVADVMFPSGARVILTGPATLDSLSADTARLSEGQLTAQVPREAVGFVIDTPDARIVDLGTVFSVAVTKNNGTEVAVISGRVDVLPKAGQKRPHRLVAGEGVRIVSADAGGPTQAQ